MKPIQVIDSHTEGNPTRVILSGFPIPKNKTLLERVNYLKKKKDHFRKILNHEPRGNSMMCSVLLMPPMIKGCDYSVIIMEQDEYVPMCGHCIIGTATTLVYAKKLKQKKSPVTIKFHTLAGIIECKVHIKNGNVDYVSFINAESFLLHQNYKIKTKNYGKINVDIAYGGDYYAIVSADKLKIKLNLQNDQEIIRCANEISTEMLKKKFPHPKNKKINRCYMVQFISNKRIHNKNNSKTTVVAPPGAIDRSPCGTGTSARVAQLFSKGKLKLNQKFHNEGPLGTKFIGKVISSKIENKILYIRPQVSGRAYITGINEIILDKKDPIKNGFRVGSKGKL